MVVISTLFFSDNKISIIKMIHCEIQLGLM